MRGLMSFLDDVLEFVGFWMCNSERKLNKQLCSTFLASFYCEFSSTDRPSNVIEG